MNLLAIAPAWTMWILVVLLAAASVQDMVQLKISNVITLPVLVLALVAMALVGLRVDLWQNVLVFAAVLTLGTLLFTRGILGGGDVKLFAAVALWTDLTGGLRLVASILFCGGLLALAVLAFRILAGRRNPREGEAPRRSEIPYGVAIAAGTLVMLLAFPNQPRENPSLPGIAPIPIAPPSS